MGEGPPEGIRITAEGRPKQLVALIMIGKETGKKMELIMKISEATTVAADMWNACKASKKIHERAKDLPI